MARPLSSYLKLESEGVYRRLHASEAARLLGISVRSVRSWLRGDAQPDRSTSRLLEILGLGVFPWEGWRGFSIDPEARRLYTPNGYTLTPGDLEHLSMIAQERQLLCQEQRELRARISELEDEVACLSQTSSGCVRSRRRRLAARSPNTHQSTGTTATTGTKPRAARHSGA